MRLCDVNEHGASARVSYGVLNLTHRDSHAHPTPLVPGLRYAVRLQLNDIAYAFPAGHRMRLALATCYWPTVWPAPAPVTITLYTGSSALTLPERPPRAADRWLVPFAAPEGAAAPAMTTLRQPTQRRDWRYDAQDDRAETVIEQDSGLERFDAIDVAVGTRVSQRYAITGGDPLSATAALAWVIVRERADWHIRIEAELALRCAAGAFVVEQALRAYEGEDGVYARAWCHEIPRDLV